jgi:flagellar biosynthesis protein FliR
VELGFSIRTGLTSLVDNLDETFHLCLRIASPFVVYAVIVNFAVGLANKLTPSIPVYFISLPFVLMGGLMLLYISSREMILQFSIAFAAWLAG